ncbi:MAG: hypothetical protein AAGF51_09395 [Pseudomonadota bacterium]
MVAKFLRTTTAALALTAATVTSAAACYKVTFHNNTTTHLWLIYEATGCLGIEEGILKACKKAWVDAGTSYTYQYDWGKTFPIVYVRHPTTGKKGKYLYMGNKYNKFFGEFVASDGPLDDSGLDNVPNCSKDFTITFTEASFCLLDDTEWNCGGLVNGQ